jgi:hypothetical protein
MELSTPVTTTTYEPPAVERREPVDLPLLGAPIGSVQPSSAAFRTESVAGYEPPAVERREPVDLPLLGAPVGSVTFSAAFRTEPVVEYERPRIDAREPIDLPLVGGPAVPSGPVGVSASFRTAVIEPVVEPVGAPYEAPSVEAREDLDLPLTVATSVVPCARFRSTTISGT